MHRLPVPVLPILLAVLLAACAPGEQPRLASQRAGLEIQVPGDFASIQAALDAASPGDVVQVAAGDYTENLIISTGVVLQGNGPQATRLHGQVDFDTYDGAAGATLRGFGLTAAGASGLGPNIGVQARGDAFVIEGNTIEGFDRGVTIDSGDSGTVRANLVRLNGSGIEVWEIGGVEIVNNLVLNNSKSGLVVFADAAPLIRHNTFVGNGFGAGYDQGGAAVVVGPYNDEVLRNNILVSNHGGLNRIEGGGVITSVNDHNLVWGNVDNFVGLATPGAGLVSLDPLFVDAPAKDYRLRADSPAIDAGLDLGVTDDFDGNPRPDGPVADMGAFEHQTVVQDGDLIVSEVLANSVVEGAGEFVELYNPTQASIDAAGLVLSDGDALDWVEAYAGGDTLVPPGGYAVILDPDYVDLGDPYDIPAGTVLLTVDDTALGSGLSTSDPISLIRAGVVLSTWAQPFDPGDGISAERIDLSAADEPGNWAASPCGASPGLENCISSGGGPVGAPTLIISEVMADPAVQTVGEYVELFNYGADPVELVGLRVSDGDSTDDLVAVAGKDSLLPAGGYAVIIDPDLVPTMASAPYQLDASVPVVVTVDDTAIGNGLTSSDPVSLLTADGETVVSTFSHPAPTDAQSIERVDLEGADLAGNWVPSPCPEGHSAGRPNCAGSGGPGELPALIINEVMANALDEDTGEFVELYNAGDVAVDVAGLLLSDGDAVDVLGAFPGQAETVIPAGGYAVVLDPEYAGEYTIAPGAIWLAPANTTLGNGLTTTDPISLLAPDGLTPIATFSYPSNPGNGISIERLGAAGDVAGNWGASTCASGSSPGGPNCAGGGQAPQPPAAGDLVINEFLADPDQADGDANCDGLRSATDDEFVELVNVSAAAVSLDGVSLSDGLDVRHVFAAGTTLEPGEAMVVFGGGPMLCPDFDGVQVVATSTGGLSLNNAGDTILLADAQAAPLAQVVYGAEAGDGQSMTLDPDLDDLDPDPVTVSGFVPHMQADQAGDSSRFSPGRRVDGSSF